jgi:hypothetical protein
VTRSFFKLVYISAPVLLHRQRFSKFSKQKLYFGKARVLTTVGRIYEYGVLLYFSTSQQKINDRCKIHKDAQPQRPTMRTTARSNLHASRAFDFFSVVAISFFPGFVGTRRHESRRC